jgi:hypothetical protein
MDLDDSGFEIYDYITTSGSFLVLKGNRDLTESYSLEFKLDGNILANSSGTQDIGSISVPFATGYFKKVYADSVITTGINPIPVYWELPSGVVDGSNSNFSLLYAPYNNSLMLTKNGTFMIPSGVHPTTADYTLSGNMISFIVPPASGAVILAASYTHL